MHTSCRQFLNACAEQRLRLHDEVEHTLRGPVGAHRQADIYQSPLIAAVDSATWIAETTDNPITDRPVDLGRLPADPVMHLLANIANSALRPRIQPKLFENIDPSLAQQTCRDAENNWSHVFHKLACEAERPGVEIFTEGDVIVALRKIKGNASGLLLQQRRLGQLDFVFPPGTLLQLETANEPSPLHKRDIRMPHGLKRTEWGDVTRLNPSRPSMYALPQQYRSIHFGTHWRVAKSISMERIQQLAERALARCAFLNNDA